MSWRKMAPTANKDPPQRTPEEEKENHLPQEASRAEPLDFDQERSNIDKALVHMF